MRFTNKLMVVIHSLIMTSLALKYALAYTLNCFSITPTIETCLISSTHRIENPQVFFSH